MGSDKEGGDSSPHDKHDECAVRDPDEEGEDDSSLDEGAIEGAEDDHESGDRPPSARLAAVQTPSSTPVPSKRSASSSGSPHVGCCLL